MKYDAILRLDPSDAGFEAALSEALIPFRPDDDCDCTANDPEIDSLTEAELVNRLVELTMNHRSVLCAYHTRLRQRAARDRMTACLLGGGMGDALGYPLEFMNWPSIVREYGRKGLTDMPFSGEVSDDTQMTLFTAEAVTLLKSELDWIPTVRLAYQRWYYTQSYETAGPEQEYAGGLLDCRDMFNRKLSSDTVIHMLSRGHLGSIHAPHNMSKGVAAMVRVAPCAVMKDPFQRGCEAAAITHNHPTGYLAAGAFALMLSLLMKGVPIMDTIEPIRRRLVRHHGHEELMHAIDSAVLLAETHPADSQLMEQKLGGGWTCEEAFAIALYCVLSYPDDFRAALLLSVNHSGDSDSTGALCGSLMGMRLGMDALPEKWHKYLELGDHLKEFAGKLIDYAVQNDTL